MKQITPGELNSACQKGIDIISQVGNLENEMIRWVWGQKTNYVLYYVFHKIISTFLLIIYHKHFISAMNVGIIVF